MACNKCGRGKCRCKKVTIFDDRPEVIKVNTIPVPGKDGNTPYVGINGNWWIDGQDTGIPATGPIGPEGDIAAPILDSDFFSI